MNAALRNWAMVKLSTQIRYIDPSGWRDEDLWHVLNLDDVKTLYLIGDMDVYEFEDAVDHVLGLTRRKTEEELAATG